MPRKQPFAPDAAVGGARPERAWRSDPWSSRDLLVLLGIALLGTALRLWHLEQWSLSAAEAATWQGATEPLGGQHGFLASERSYHPFGFLLLRGLFHGALLPFHGEGWLRLPFAFVGMLTVPLVALVGDLFVGRRAALLAAGLLACHPWHVAVSQTATGDVGALFFAVAAAGVGVLAHRLVHRGCFAAAVALGFASAGCHPAGWLALAGLAAAALVVAPTRARRLGYAALLGGLLAGSGACVLAIAGGPRGAPPLGEFVAAARPALLLLAAFGVGAAGCVGVGSRERRWLLVGVGLPALGLLAPPLLGVGADAGLALLALPALLLFGSVGALAWFKMVQEALAPQRWVTIPALLAPGILGLDLGVETFLYGTVHQGNRADWRAAAEAVLDAATRGRPLAVLAGAGAPSLTYYLRPNHWREAGDDPHPGLAVRAVAVLDLAASADWLERARQERDVFLVLARAEIDQLPRHEPSRQWFEATFRAGAVVPHPTAANAGTIYVHRALPAAPR